MAKIIELPPIEKWDGDNEGLYFYGDTIVMEDGSYDFVIYKMPFPIPQAFYRRRKVPSNMLNDPQYDNCKYCDDMLTDPYWRRMHMCRKCYLEEPWKKPLFQYGLSKDTELK